MTTAAKYATMVPVTATNARAGPPAWRPPPSKIRHASDHNPLPARTQMMPRSSAITPNTRGPAQLRKRETLSMPVRKIPTWKTHTSTYEIHATASMPSSSAPPGCPSRVFRSSASAVDAKYVCTPYQKIATTPRTIAGRLAPRMPMLARASTG